MAETSKLSITIPTYNRSEFLDFFLELHIPRVRKYNIPIHISDCNSPDNTREVVKKWQKKYEYLHYFCTKETVHPDENAENAVNLSSAEYTWLIGDSYEIPEKSLDEMIVLLSSEDAQFDVISVNLVGRLKEHKVKTYNDCNEVLADLTWMMACVSCNIYHRRLIENGDQSLYRGSCFCQVGFILDFIGKNTFKLYWAQNIIIETLKHPILRKKGWGEEFFSIMFKKWPNFISSLPVVYKENARIKALKDLPHRTLLLGWRNVLHLRGSGFLNEGIYKEYHGSFDKVASNSFKRYAYFLTLTPQFLCNGLICIIEWARRRNYRIRRALNLLKN